MIIEDNGFKIHKGLNQKESLIVDSEKLEDCLKKRMKTC